jgi:hypothetical protein
MSDTIYNSTDINMLYNNLTELNENIKKLKSILYKPDLEEKKKIQNIILNYIKEKKKKIYGGYALNKLLMNKNYESFYKDYEINDIDFYSVDPNTDIIELCNIFHESGYKTSAREARHPNTYSIFVEYDLYCDITYAPACIFNSIPSIQLEGFYYTNPSFMIIDYLRMITDPLSSYWRLEKSFERLYMLEREYPLPKFTKPIEINNSDSDYLIKKCINIIINCVKEIDEIVIVGFYAYLYFLKVSKLFNKNRNLIEFSKKNYDDIPFIELISKNFKQDSLKIINLLKEQFEITYTEYYPFFTFTGNSVEIYVDSNLICIIYDYDNRPIPYIKSENLKIGSFSQVLLNAQINTIRYRTQKEDELKYMYMIMVSHLIQMKSYYLKENKKTIFDSTPFKDFVLDFLKPEINPDIESHLKYERRKSNNKPGIFIYDPSKLKKDEKVENFYFPNISGNEIVNEKRQQLNINKLNTDENENENELIEIKSQIDNDFEKNE